MARRVAKGDLTADVNVDSYDEAGKLLQAPGTMNTSLRGLITEVMQSAETITSASSEIAQGNADLSSRTESQAASIEETASSMEELTATVAHSADNAGLANKLALGATALATMTDIVKSIKTVAQKMTEITAATREQNTGLNSINQVFAEMDNSTRKNAAMVEQASAAAMSMQDEATRLNQAISVFRTSERLSTTGGRALALR